MASLLPSLPDWLPLLLVTLGAAVVVYALPGPIRAILLKPLPADRTAGQVARRAWGTFAATVTIGLALIAGGIAAGDLAAPVAAAPRPDGVTAPQAPHLDLAR